MGIIWLSPSRLPFFYGWVILPVAGLAMFISGPGQTYSFSVFVDPMRDELGLSQTGFAAIYTAGSLTAAVAMVLIGRLLDRLGARVMLTAVGVLFGLGALWMSTVSNQGELFLGITVMRLLGQGALTLIPTTLIALWFIRWRGRVTAINSLGTAISQAAFPPLLVLMLSRMSWQDTWATLAFVIWGAIILPVVLLVRRSPESVQLLPDGDKLPARSSRRRDVVGVEQETNYTLSEAMGTRAFWLLLLAGSTQALINTALIFNNESFISSKGLDTAVAASIFVALAPMVLVGSFIAGFLADKYPNRYLLAVGQVLVAVAMLWTLLIAEPWHALVYGGMLGFGGGFFVTITAVIWPNYFGRHNIGSIRGVATTALVGFSALGPLAFAFLYDLSGDFLVPVEVFLILPVLGMVASLAAVPPAAKVRSS